MTDRLIAIDLDNTFADYTTAFADCLAQMGRPVRGGDPTSYDFGCDGWFGEGNGDVFPEFHSRAVMFGLYLRERPYPHARRAVDTLTFDHPAWHVAFVTSRRDDGDDTARWMLGLGIDMSLEFDYADQCLDHMDPTGMELGRAVSERARSCRWSMACCASPTASAGAICPTRRVLRPTCTSRTTRPCSTGSWTWGFRCSSGGTPTTRRNANAPNSRDWDWRSKIGRRCPDWRNG